MTSGASAFAGPTATRRMLRLRTTTRRDGIMTIAREELKHMDFRDVATGKRLAPVHPGEVLMRDFIDPMGITRYKVAKLTKVQQRRIDEICSGNRAITGDTAMRLARLFGMDAAFGTNLQANNDLEMANQKRKKVVKNGLRRWTSWQHR